MTLELITHPSDASPAVEPLSRADAKLHLKIPSADTDDDALVDAYIRGARSWAEAITGRALINQTWKLTLRDWPDDNILHLPKGKAQSVSAFTYVDTDGVTQDLTAESPLRYALDFGGTGGGKIRLAYDKTWPDVREQFDAIQLTWICGFGTAATDIPEQIVDAIRFRVADLYEVRGSQDAALNRGRMEGTSEDSLAYSLLHPWRINFVR